MKQINIFLWYIFYHKKYNLYQYIQTLGFDSESSYRDMKNLDKSAIDFLIK